MQPLASYATTSVSPPLHINFFHIKLRCLLHPTSQELDRHFSRSSTMHDVSISINSQYPPWQRPLQSCLHSNPSTMASPSTPALSTLRKPLESQRNVGSDMSMMALVQTGCPSRFASPDEHRIKGLNAETIARVCLPTPTWLMSPEYAILQSTGKNSENQIYVSLNIAIYNQQLDPSEWTEQWFFMTGRLHPYALTWRITQLDGLESEIGTVSEYTIPAFIVRDSSFQP